MSDLIDLAFYKAAVGETTAKYDVKYAAAIAAASAAIRSYTDRSFDTNIGVASSRVYEYDDSGFLDIDDCETITSVSTDAGVPNGDPITLIAGTDFTGLPVAGPVYYYLRLTNTYRGYSPEMGFARNLDTMPYSQRPSLITVTAVWGWPAIPADVQWATVWTAAAMTGPMMPYVTESIEGYSRSTNIRLPSTGVPDRAADLLAPYVRQLV